jgi:CrcB protein
MSIFCLFCIGCGGALGAMLRGFCTDKLKPHATSGFPWPTLSINIAACIIAGIITGLSLDSCYTIPLCMGFLGALSTMSTMNYEAVTLYVHRERRRCFFYLVLSYALCIGSLGVASACVHAALALIV